MDGVETNVDSGPPTKHSNAENGGLSVRCAATLHSSGPEVRSVPIAIEPTAKLPDSPRSSSCPPGPPCSTPMAHDRRSNSTNDLVNKTRDRSASQTSQTQTDQIAVLELDDLKVPIVGYEIMEQRAKFTVFKLLVNRGSNDNWFVFRRYTDFVRINDQLKFKFPTFRLALPPKKWFGNNFDLCFLEDRQLGLQAFINNITGHKDIVRSKCVREFFCLDEPPGPHDSLEESRALCESLEDAAYHLRHEVTKKDKIIARLTEEVVSLRGENEQLLKSLRGESGSSSFRQSSPPPGSESSLAECEYPSAVEADQSHTNGDSDKSSMLKRNLSNKMLEEITVVTLRKTFRVRFSDIVNEFEYISSLEY